MDLNVGRPILNRALPKEITWTQLRNKVEPSIAEKSVIKHTDYLTNSEIIISKAVSITETEVLTKDSNHVPYNYLVIASGHYESYPKTKSDRLHQYHKLCFRLQLVIFSVIKCIQVHLACTRVCRGKGQREI